MLRSDLYIKLFAPRPWRRKTCAHKDVIRRDKSTMPSTSPAFNTTLAAGRHSTAAPAVAPSALGALLTPRQRAMTQLIPTSLLHHVI